MKSLIRYGLAAVMLFAIAMPAMAKTIDVCVTGATDVAEDSSKTFFTAAAPFFTKGTIEDGVTECPARMDSIGTFYTAGGFFAPTADTNGNAGFATWVFIFAKGGKFVTAGIVNATADYTQTITGANGGFPNSGKVTVHNFSLGTTCLVTTPPATCPAFAFSVTYP
jgi:hypothetical protein